MTDDVAQFQFVGDPTAYRDEDALIVRVPAKARGKEKLLHILADKLRLPRYFGHNWDALEECLGDLAWLSDAGRVAIVHEGLPFSPAGEQLTIYLAVLRSGIARRAAAEIGPRLGVVFAERVRDAISAAG